MHKTIFSFLLACLVFVGAGGLYARAVVQPSVGKQCISKSEIDAQDRAECQAKVIATLESQVGVRENLGPNDSVEIREYLRLAGFNTSVAYCAAFACWGFTVNGICNPQTAWSPSLFPKDHLIDHKYVDPEPADTFGVYYTNLGRIAHAGVIKYWPRDGDTFISIEGNTNDNGSRNGDGVYLKRSLKRRAYKISRWI